MNVTLFPPLAFNQIGQRDNNEDSVSPPVGTAGPECRVFIVCDGVGGGASGEVASRIVADGMTTYFNALTGPSNEETVAEALRAVEQALDAYLQQEPDTAGMATTLTLLHLHEQGATVAHVGDSRVYCCRDGRAAFQTDDHKLVNEWVKNGILTPEQAAEHPQQNVITRAVRGSAKPVQADVALLQGLRPDDYFFLCTDGVLENLTTEKLCVILSTSDTDETKLAAIRACCDGQTRDNYSAYLVHVQTVDPTADETTSEPIAVSSTIMAPSVKTKPKPLSPVSAHTPASTVPRATSAPATPNSQRPAPPAEPPLLTKRSSYLLIGLVALGLMAWLMFGRRSHMSPTEAHWPQYQAPAKPHTTIPLQANPLSSKPNRP
jgi:serine/threonine protein phosphatase PrpC